MKTPLHNLSHDEYTSLRAWRDSHGRTWRAALRALWESGQDTAELRAVRNKIGPSGLDKVKLV